jgi:succinate dehydrogenase / fumarate reductase cytochrome b subunit
MGWQSVNLASRERLVDVYFDSICALSFKSVMAHPIIKLIVLALIWSYLHHFCAGIRFLMLDLHKGIDKYSAAKSAVGVLVVSLSLTAVCAAKLFGLF